MSVTDAPCSRASGRGRSDRAPGLRRDVRGSASLEFALVAVPLIALMLATIETALISFSQQALETSTETAARIIMTGRAQSGRMTQTQFHDLACTTLPTYLSCAKLMVDVRRAASFGTVSLAPPAITFDASGNVSNSFSYDVGTGGDIVIVRLMYLWPVSNSPMALSLANGGGGNNHLLIATNVAKNEPFT